METYKAHETVVIDPGCMIGDGTLHLAFFPYYAGMLNRSELQYRTECRDFSAGRLRG